MSDTPAAPYFNDLESDAEYRGYPYKSLEDFLRPQLMMYMAKPVARNTFHLHVFVDPATPEVKTKLEGLERLGYRFMQPIVLRNIVLDCKILLF